MRWYIPPAGPLAEHREHTVTHQSTIGTGPASKKGFQEQICDQTPHLIRDLASVRHPWIPWPDGRALYRVLAIAGLL